MLLIWWLLETTLCLPLQGLTGRDGPAGPKGAPGERVSISVPVAAVQRLGSQVAHKAIRVEVLWMVSMAVLAGPCPIVLLWGLGMVSAQLLDPPPPKPHSYAWSESSWHSEQAELCGGGRYPSSQNTRSYFTSPSPIIFTESLIPYQTGSLSPLFLRAELCPRFSSGEVVVCTKHPREQEGWAGHKDRATMRTQMCGTPE